MTPDYPADVSRVHRVCVAYRNLRAETAALSLLAARRVVDQFRSDASIDRFRALAKTDYAYLLAVSSRLIKRARERPVTWFNPFVISGYRPSENEISNGLAALFDPRAPHGLGATMLRALVRAALHDGGPTGADSPSLSALLDAISATPPALISVRREFYDRLGRPDIVIRGRGEHPFLLFIENKIRGGIETQTPDGSETDRHRQILDQVADRLRIPATRRLAIFLTPEGRRATANSFVELSTARLAASMHDELRETTADERLKHVIGGYLLTYAWINGA